MQSDIIALYSGCLKVSERRYIVQPLLTKQQSLTHAYCARNTITKSLLNYFQPKDDGAQRAGRKPVRRSQQNNTTQTVRSLKIFLRQFNSDIGIFGLLGNYCIVVFCDVVMPLWVGGGRSRPHT